MPKKSVGWPAAGQMSHDLGEHSKLILDDARQLLEFGAPPDEGGTGKQCPYHTLNAFCTSVIAYLESSEGPASRQNEKHDLAAREGFLATPLSAQSANKLHHESPSVYKNSRQISQPLTPQQNKQEHKSTPFSERAQPLNVDSYGVLVLYVPSNFDVDNQKRAIEGLVSVNKGFIPGISIKSIEWLIPDWTKTKHYSNLLVEFHHPQHANAAIREQLLVGNKVLSCEYYERDSRLRQCFFCQQYRHQDAQCQAAKPVCGRCAGHHATSACKVREETQNFRCAICGGKHRAWDSVCRVRQEELDRVRTARVDAPKYHAENGIVPKDEGNGDRDTPSRDFAGTRRYSIDFLVEVNLRGGRKSHGRNRAKDRRQSALPVTADDVVSVQELDTPPSTRTKAIHTVPDSISTPKSAGATPEVDRYSEWIRSRLLTMGIEPYTPRVQRQDKDKEDIEMAPTTPTPVHRPKDNWDRIARGDNLSNFPERTRKSLESAMKLTEKSPSERAANVAKIRNSDSWR